MKSAVPATREKYGNIGKGLLYLRAHGSVKTGGRAFGVIGGLAGFVLRRDDALRN